MRKQCSKRISDYRLDSPEDENYIDAFVEEARTLWGDEVVSKIKSHLEQTAKAVQTISCYPLNLDVEPVTKMKLGEK
jgi:hypothetical protein